jgi:deoxycytidylate deaminase
MDWRIFGERGEQGFLTELERNSPWSATVPFADLRATYKETGVGAAIARAQQILSVAENHEASIRGPGAR